MLKGTRQGKKPFSKEGFPLSSKKSPNCAYLCSYSQMASRSGRRHGSLKFLASLSCGPGLIISHSHIQLQHLGNRVHDQRGVHGDDMSCVGLAEVPGSGASSGKKCILPGHKACSPSAILKCVMVTVGCDFPPCFPSGMR